MGIAIICRNANYANKGLGKVTMGASTDVYPTSISISGSSEFSGASNQYSVSYTPSNANMTGVTWSVVSGGEYATIDQSGLLTMTDTSMTEDVSITIKVVSAADTSVYAEKTLTWVYVSEDTDIYPTALTINGEESFNGDSLQLSVGYTPTTTNRTEVTWSLTSGTDYASIDQNGLITMNNTSLTSDVTIGVKVVSQHDESVYAEKVVTWIAGVVEEEAIELSWSYGYWDKRGTDIISNNLFFCSDKVSLTKNCDISISDGYKGRLCAFNLKGACSERSEFITGVNNLKDTLLALSSDAFMWGLNLCRTETQTSTSGVELTDAELQNINSLVTFSNIENLYDSALDKSNLTIEGYGIRATTGELVPYNNWEASDYINIDSFSTLILTTTDNAGSFGMAFYDSDKNYVSGVIFKENTNETIDISDYTYLRFSSLKTNGVFIILNF